MAETQDDIEIIEEGANKSKLLIIIIAVLVLALTVVGAMMLLGNGDKSAVEDESVAIAAKQAPIYYTLEKPLIVNFGEQSQGAVRYLSVKLKVMARDQLVIDAFTLNEPAIQHELLMLLLGQKYDELNTAEGTKALQQQTLVTINEVLKAEKTSGELESVYFTSLLMQ
jgi:flagellar FliL protein